MRLVSELRRRNVLRMAVLYVVAAWLIMQATEVTKDLANLPDWIGPIVLALLVIGFPIALVFSWFFEITPEGISLEKDVDRAASITAITGRRLDFIIISILCAAVILFAYDKWWIGPPPEKSIAVLPFVNVSDDAENEYFSDGISEELLNLLAKIPELRVISRSSAFSYKGKDIVLADVARELNVSNILEGSVRKDGNQVRITVQLIEAGSDTQLWSETYDRTLGDIFSVQDEIAAMVVDNLSVTLLNETPSIAKTDPEAYALYLQAEHLRRLVSADSLQKATIIYQDVLATDPKYEPAWLGLINAYNNLAALRAMPSDEIRRLYRDALEHSIEILPDSAGLHEKLAWDYFVNRGDLNAAARHYERALKLEPTNISLIGNISTFLLALGRIDQGILFNEYFVSRDPVSLVAHNNLGIAYRMSGRYEEAKEAFSMALALSPSAGGVEYELGVTLLLSGDYAAATTAFEREPIPVFGQIGMAMTNCAHGETAAADQIQNDLIVKYGEDIAYYFAQVLAYCGKLDGAFGWLNKASQAKHSDFFHVINEPLLSNLHADPRWLSFLDRIGKSADTLAGIEFNVKLPS